MRFLANENFPLDAVEMHRIRIRPLPNLSC